MVDNNNKLEVNDIDDIKKIFKSNSKILVEVVEQDKNDEYFKYNFFALGFAGISNDFDGNKNLVFKVLEANYDFISVKLKESLNNIAFYSSFG